MLTGCGPGPDILPLNFQIQEGFQRVDFTLPAQDRAEQSLESLKALFSGMDGTQILHVVLASQFAVDKLMAEGAVYAANFVGRSRRDPSSATMAQFTVLVRAARLNAARPLDAVAEGLRRERKHGRVVDFVDIKIGRCLVVLEDDRVVLPRKLTGESVEDVHYVRQMQVIFPIVDRGHLVSFTISTEFLQDWDDYVEMMAEICRSISWTTNESDAGSISSVLDGGL